MSKEESKDEIDDVVEINEVADKLFGNEVDAEVDLDIGSTVENKTFPPQAPSFHDCTNSKVFELIFMMGILSSFLISESIFLFVRLNLVKED